MSSFICFQLVLPCSINFDYMYLLITIKRFKHEGSNSASTNEINTAKLLKKTRTFRIMRKAFKEDSFPEFK